jgi:hypothetical protein
MAPACGDVPLRRLEAPVGRGQPRDGHLARAGCKCRRQFVAEDWAEVARESVSQR